MKQLDNKNMQEYWEEHSRCLKDLDRKRDPEGLTNVCYSYAPLWFNKFFAYFQTRNFNRLLRLLQINKIKALDMGCGCGRWCSVLKNKGFDVTGIDLQKETIENNKVLIKDCKFYVMSADNLNFDDETFDLITSITVIQHIPYAEQEKVFDEIKRVLKKGGYFLMIENTKDIGLHVFPRNFDGWKDAIKKRGFILIKSYGQEYAPLLHFFDYVTRKLNLSDRKKLQNATGKDLANNEKLCRENSLKKQFYIFIKYILVLTSYPLEFLCDFLLPREFAKHGVYLFRKM